MAVFRFLFHRLILRSVRQHIDFALTSTFGGARAGRVKRKRAKAAAAGSGDAAEEEDDE